MTKRRGVTTLEAMLLAPIVLFLFICLIDMLFIVHNRTVLQADLSRIERVAEQHLAQVPDILTVSALSDWQNGNSELIEKNRRGIVDSLHLFLDKDQLAARIKSELTSARRSGLYSVESLAIESEINWFSMRYYLTYDIAIQSPFAHLTGHIFGGYQTVSGRRQIDSYSHIEQFHDIELVIDHLEKLQEIEMLIKTVRGVFVN